LEEIRKKCGREKRGEVKKKKKSNLNKKREK
jgi:hypothetical protein